MGKVLGGCLGGRLFFRCFIATFPSLARFNHISITTMASSHLFSISWFASHHMDSIVGLLPSQSYDREAVELVSLLTILDDIS